MTHRFKRIQVIINPAAGGDEPVLNTLNDVFKEHDIHWDVAITHKRGDGQRLARQAVEAGVDLVAAYGGDGTQMDVAGGLAGTGTPMAILTGGTGNAKAAELGIPQDLKGAAELLCGDAYRVRQIDVGEIDGTAFLLRAGVGFEADVTARADRELKDRFGVFAYAIGIMESIARPETVDYRLTLDGEVVERTGFSLIIANGGGIGTLNLSLPYYVATDDGLLDVFVLDSPLTMAASMTGLDEIVTALQHWQVREVEVVATPAQRAQADGELLGETPVTATVLPRALHIVTPRED